MGSVVHGTVAMFFAYGGWRTRSFPAERSKSRGAFCPSRSPLVWSCWCRIHPAAVRDLATIGTAATDHPLADVASSLMGDAGRVFISVAAMISTYGYLAAAFCKCATVAVRARC